MANYRIRRTETFDFPNPDEGKRITALAYEFCGDELFHDPVHASATARLGDDGRFHLERTIEYKGPTEELDKSVEDLETADRIAYNILAEIVKKRGSIFDAIIDESTYNELSKTARPL
jgi:hypothetical protein